MLMMMMMMLCEVTFVVVEEARGEREFGAVGRLQLDFLRHCDVDDDDDDAV
jgi:hypothetical protein